MTANIGPTKVAADFVPVLQELETGEPWNALARLRRLVEIELRQRLSQRGGDADQSVLQQLHYAVDMANRAVHGYDVSAGEAHDRSINLARVAWYPSTRVLRAVRAGKDPALLLFSGSSSPALPARSMEIAVDRRGGERPYAPSVGSVPGILWSTKTSRLLSPDAQGRPIRRRS